MPRLSEKYVAGFLDADGSVGLVFHGYNHTPQLQIGFSQRQDRDEVLYRIQEVIGGTIDNVGVNETIYSRLTLWSSAAKMALNRIQKYLVIKKHYAGVVLETVGNKVGDVEALKQMLKQHRRIKSLPIPNFPSRKWMAGYIDGDGCFSTTRMFKGGSVGLIFHIAASDYDTEGMELIQRGFGGNIYPMREGILQYTLSLPPSKAIQFISHFGKYSIVKKKQVDFILGCARMGHYRDGKRIKEQLTALKAHKQRLNDSGIGNNPCDSPA